MNSIDVTLTDYALTLICLYFASHLKKVPGTFFWRMFFLAAGVAAALGGTYHGFFEGTESGKWLWLLTTLSIGIAAECAWLIAGVTLTGARYLRAWLAFATINYVAYAGVLLFYSQSFLIVILNYLPATALLFFVSLIRYAQTNHKGHLAITVGLATTFLAAYIQQAHVALHPLYFNHNSTYHLVQATGLFLLFRGASLLCKLNVN